MIDVIETSASQEAEERSPYYPYNTAVAKAAAERGRATKLGLSQTETQAIIGLLLLGRSDIAQKFDDAALMAQTCDADVLECYDINGPYGDWYAALMGLYRRHGFAEDVEPQEMIDHLTSCRMWGVGRPNGPRRGEPDRLDLQRGNLFTCGAEQMAEQDYGADLMALANHLIEEANGCAGRRDLIMLGDVALRLLQSDSESEE
jgi:hypothetical protein